MGLAAACVGEALVPTARDRGRSRSRLRIAQTARPMPKPLQPDHLHHPLAFGCCSLRAGPATTPPSDGKASAQGLSVAKPLRSGPRSEYAVEVRGSRLLVWR